MKPVYVLGRTRGALSHLVTQELASLPEQPSVPRIVYLLRSDRELRSFLNHDSTLTIRDYSLSRAVDVSQVQLMSACAPPQYDSGELAHIESMMCSFKKPRDVTELQRYKGCFTKESSLLLLDGDKSFSDSLRKLVWRDKFTRPQLYQCLSDIRTWSSTNFESGVVGDGSLRVAKIPRDLKDLDSYEYDLGANLSQEGELIDMLSRTRRLNTTFMKYTDFVHVQYEHMIVKTAIGAYTALFDCTNGELLKMKHTPTLLKNLINECLKVIATADPAAFRAPNSRVVLDSDRILDVAVTMMKMMNKESTLLRRQVALWNNTELTNTTGYFTYHARQHKVHCLHLNMIHKILEAKTSLASLRYQKVSYDDTF
ncbi:CYFA0S15e02498g1_1 [Cyberlindnera fabianii]|uniref:CYFA0S15e02498g1_1 n=2 Tax=Cyberlindnera fabianii TaxID=36022 RepID=A0A061B4M4_CYBFA|nr:CYFA0S15e02498g1_1 [Cyberlindnera fabianii]